MGNQNYNKYIFRVEAMVCPIGVGQIELTSRNKRLLYPIPAGLKLRLPLSYKDGKARGNISDSIYTGVSLLSIGVKEGEGYGPILQQRDKQREVLESLLKHFLDDLNSGEIITGKSFSKTYYIDRTNETFNTGARGLRIRTGKVCSTTKNHFARSYHTH